VLKTFYDASNRRYTNLLMVLQTKRNLRNLITGAAFVSWRKMQHIGAALAPVIPVVSVIPLVTVIPIVTVIYILLSFEHHNFT
jgi:hypothetical protein